MTLRAVEVTNVTVLPFQTDVTLLVESHLQQASGCQMSFQQRAIEAIRDSGGRMTTQREILLRLLEGADEDIDAEHLHHLASQEDPNLSLPTVYRTLNTLEDAQVISGRYLSIDHDRKVYRISPQGETYHFTCRNCGRIIAFQSDIIDQLKQAVSAQIGADVATLCMCAGGLCADCREEHPSMTLDQLEIGQPATIRRVGGAGAVRRRLMDMGLVRGVGIEKVRTAPLGDPVEYVVRGYHLSLRKSEAQLVEVELRP